MEAAFIAYFSVLFIPLLFYRFYKLKSYVLKTILGKILPLLIVSIILGGRFETGTDWPQYKSYYDDILNFGLSIKYVLTSSLEPLYLLLNKLISLTGLGSSVFFSFVSFINYSVVYKIYQNKRIQLLPFALFFYTLCNLSLTINIVRQALAMSFVFLSLLYLEKNRLLSFLTLVVAVGFHYSAVFILPLMAIDRHIFNYLNKRGVVFLLYLITLIFGEVLNNYASNIIQSINFEGKYGDNAEQLAAQMVLSSGYGLWAKHFLNFLVIFLWFTIKDSSKDMFHKNAFILYIIGICLSNIFGISVFLSRLSLYYSEFRFMVEAFCVYVIFNKQQYNKLIPLAIVVLLINVLTFSMGIIRGVGGCSPYSFNWIM